MVKIKKVISRILPLQEEILVKAQKRLDNLTKPLGSLGRLEEVAKKVAAIKERLDLSLKRKVIFVFAADHGVAEEGVSAYPQEVTYQMVYNFLQGGAGINVLAKHIGAEVVVIDIGVARDLKSHPHLKIKKIGYGTKNMVKEQAMSRKEAIQSIEAGIEVFEEEHRKAPVDIAGLGDMGIANTTSSSALLAAISGEDPEKVTGRGTGIDDQIWQKKVEVIKKALQAHLPHTKDPIDVLAKVGGYEIGGIAGCILAAAKHRVPAVIDGFISTVGALIAAKLSPGVREYLFTSHLSTEKGHRVALDRLKLSPLLNLNLRLGEGTGAALAISIVEASVKILTQMATFEQARVSRKRG
jgi:nicotinate-nucleotide--dimethylbenzimidazole phosphoribosyltransferase